MQVSPAPAELRAHVCRKPWLVPPGLAAQESQFSTWYTAMVLFPIVSPWLGTEG